MDPSDKKFATLKQRLQSKIKEADSLAHGRNGSVLPLLTRHVFVQFLLQRAVPLVQCPAEADREIACLAHQWKCPVLTSDSDFYIFDLPGGYLPFQYFHWNNLSGKSSHRYISARCYTTNNLCRRFGGMNPELLPLCAVLTGNDYGAPEGAEALLALLDVRAYGRGGGRGKSRAPAPRIEGLLHWLSSFSSSAEALAEIRRLMGEARGQGGLSSQLWAAMQEYHITPQSSLARWFSDGKGAPGGQSSQLAQLPEFMSHKAARGLLGPFALDAFVMRRVLLIPQVENSRLPSSHCAAGAIRQAVYGILLRGESGNIGQGTRGGRGGRGWSSPSQMGNRQATDAGAMRPLGSSAPVCVEEFDRHNLNLKKNLVEGHVLKSHLCLASLGQAPVAVRLNVFLEVLGVDECALASVPHHLWLPVAVTAFWLHEATPKPPLVHLQALVLGMVHGEMTWNVQMGPPHYQHAVPQFHWPTEKRVMTALDRHRVRAGDRRGLDIGVAHGFSQWQACVWSALCLNQLLLEPLSEPPLRCLFNGTLVHGLVRYLKGGGAPESLLAGSGFCGYIFNILLHAVRGCSFKARQSSAAEGRRKRNRGRGRRGRGGGGGGGGGAAAAAAAASFGGETEAMNNRFASLMLQEWDGY